MYLKSIKFQNHGLTNHISVIGKINAYNNLAFLRHEFCSRYLNVFINVLIDI